MQHHQMDMYLRALLPQQREDSCPPVRAQILAIGIAYARQLTTASIRQVIRTCMLMGRLNLQAHDVCRDASRPCQALPRDAEKSIDESSSVSTVLGWVKLCDRDDLPSARSCSQIVSSTSPCLQSMCLGWAGGSLMAEQPALQ